jgi:hypothetical protein
MSESHRNALLWAFDRLSIDGGMTVKEQKRTMLEIGNVLRGRPSVAANYRPNDWDDSALLSPPTDSGGG